MSVIAALTSQNTKGVFCVEPVAPEFITAQLNALSDDITIDAVKIGLLSAPAIDAVASWLEHNRPRYVVLDPVMVATSGDRLLDETAEQKLKRLTRFATIITPNLPELAVLSGQVQAKTVEKAIAQAKGLQRDLGCDIFLKLGHLKGQKVAEDYIVEPEGATLVTAPWVDTDNTHGTGCSLSSALATLLVHFSGDVILSSTIAKRWLSKALVAGGVLAVGGKNETDPRQSHGPMDHFAGIIPSDFIHYATLLTSDIHEQIDSMDFIKQLSSGELNPNAFAHYIQQDNIYLDGYTKIMKGAAKFAPNNTEKEFLLSLIGEDIEKEVEFHNAWLSKHGYPTRAQEVAPQTSTYLNILDQAVQSSEYALILASLLPCTYMYYEIGKSIASKVRSQGVSITEHPYSAWIEAYSDPAYEGIVGKLVDMTNRVARQSTPEMRSQMLRHYRNAAQAEYDFFDVPLT
jgi:hydroxymethylpyrimidine kinase/phosphomethylpyrimidine kinase